MVGGSGTGDSYGGNAVVPEPLDGHEDTRAGDVIVSTNTGRVECGDGFCTGDETPASCAGDCPVCETVAAAGATIDETSLCFEHGGTASFWRRETSGFDDSLSWTHAVAAASPDNYGRWTTTFDEGGRYRVEVYTAASWAQATAARYEVRHGGRVTPFTIDQSAADGFQVLGEVDFSAGDDQWVRLDDNTGEDFALRRQLVFDALRLTRLGATPAADGGMDSSVPDAGPGADGGTPPDASMDGGVIGDPPVRDAMAGDAMAGDAAASDAMLGPDGDVIRPPIDMSGGCSVGGDPQPPAVALALALIALVARRRG